MGFENRVREILKQYNGVLRLIPNYVERFYPARGRLGLRKIYGDRGWFSERWLASCVSVLGEETRGLSRVDLGDREIFFRDIIRAMPEEILGGEYVRINGMRFGVLTKILDPGIQIPLHFHAMEYHAKRYWGSNPKEEAYYYLEHWDIGPMPYAHFGFHQDVSRDEILELIKVWEGDRILDYSPAYRCRIGEGFHVLAGVVHAPCTLLTLEVQEESDVGTIIQAEVSGIKLSKKEYLLNGPTTEEEVIDMINWDVSKDPKFYRKYHIKPVTIREERNIIERWVIGPKEKFSVLEIRIAPRTTVKQSRKAPFLLLTWNGYGKINNIPIISGNDRYDEVFITIETAKEHIITNTGDEWLIIYEIFGPHTYREGEEP